MTRGSRLRPLAKAVLRTQSDARLVALAREGRDAAFEEIVRRYRPGLVAFAAAYAPADRAEDVVQESLVRSWEALANASEEIHLKPWLYTIVRNRALNARRDAKSHEPLSDEIDGVAQPPEIVLGREELAAVVGAVGALPEAQREALVRSAVEGHTHDQIAAALQSSPGAVRQLIYRARLNLRTGVGLMIPLPLVRMLADHGGETAIAAGGVATGGAALGAAGGASMVSKFAAVAALGTLAAGAGVAIERSGGSRDKGSQTVVEQREGRDEGQAANSSPAQSSAAGSSSNSGPGSGSPGGGESEDESERGDRSGDDSGDSVDDSSGPGSGTGDDDSGDRSGSDGDDDDSNSGPGGGDDDDDAPDLDDDRSGPGGGSGSSGSGSSGSSGSGSSGSGSSGSSGSGSSGSGSGDDPPDLDDDDDSGSGSDSSGSDDDDSSGSGSGDDDSPEPDEPDDD